jgi:hypothetical protein
MPRETIIIPISKLPFPEPAAIFIAKLAFPNDSSKEAQLFAAVCRSAVLARSQEEKGWGGTPQPIRPIYFMKAKVDGKIITRAETILEHVFTAAFMADLVIVKHLTGRERRSFGPFGRKTLKHLKEDEMNRRGWKGKSEKTFTFRYWSPSKSVVHAAAAYILVTREPLIWPPRIEVFLERFESAELLRRVVILSEGIRQKTELLKELNIKERQTLQFIPD